MDEQNSTMPEQANDVASGTPSQPQSDYSKLLEELSQTRQEVSYLRDLFVRRLADDKQKNSIIQKLAEGASFAFIEPFLYDIILLLDRLEKTDDDFVKSVSEELYGIINRRGVEKIAVAKEFNPSLYKAVKVSEDTEADKLCVTGIIRNGYTLSGKVIRPAEVMIVKPAPAAINKESEVNS